MTSSLRQRLAETTLELLRIPSVTGQEREIAHHLERWALSLPRISRDDVIRSGNSLIVGQPDGHRPCVALLGHLDTVPPHEKDAPPSKQADRILGRGASDMKGGIAVMQLLLEDLDLEALPFTLMMVLYDREEGPYEQSGLEPLLDEVELLQEIDLAIAMEPTDNALELGCLGSIHARLLLRGRAAHSARPWQGENAVHRAGPLLNRLLGQKPRAVQVEGLTFLESMSVTLAQGGNARNVIPERFELNLNYRFAPSGDPRARVREAIETIRATAREAEVEIVDVAPPGPVPADNPILDHLQSVAGLEVRAKHAWTDVARLAARGIDAVNLGPGSGAQAHQAGEWISLDALERSYAMLRRVLSTPVAP